MEKTLIKYKKENKIDFIKTHLDWGLKNKEFLVYDLKTKKLSRIFYDNKYREDTRNSFEELNYYKNKLLKSLEGINDIGIYNTKEECKYYETVINFIVKYSDL